MQLLVGQQCHSASHCLDCVFDYAIVSWSSGKGEKLHYSWQGWMWIIHGLYNYPGTEKFPVLPLYCRCLTVYLALNQVLKQAEYSDSIICLDCVFVAPTGHKATQVVHKQNKCDLAIIRHVRLEPNLNTCFIIRFFRSACGHEIMCQQE